MIPSSMRHFTKCSSVCSHFISRKLPSLSKDCPLSKPLAVWELITFRLSSLFRPGGKALRQAPSKPPQQEKVPHFFHPFWWPCRIIRGHPRLELHREEHQVRVLRGGRHLRQRHLADVPELLAVFRPRLLRGDRRPSHAANLQQHQTGVPGPADGRPR